MSVPTALGRHRMITFAALEDRLRAVGYAARVTTLACPVQIEGRLPTGEVFYLRCRWSTCELDVGDPPSAATDELPTEDEVDALIDAAAWRGEVTRWRPYEASWLEAEEVERVFHELVARYIGSTQSDH